jgi:predicted component of type VI protein secretion system
MPTLTIQLPGLPPVSHVLKDETITIGRMKTNTIVIDDASISLMHAKITRKDGLFYLKDLNSTNGTMVNGQRIAEARLRDQDRVRFADITTQFDSDGEVIGNGHAPASTPILFAAAPTPAVMTAPAHSPASGQATAAPKAAQVSTSKSQRKMSRRTLAVAAAVLIVALPGLGVVVLKSAKGKSQNPDQANAPSATKSKKDAGAEVATQVPSPKPTLPDKPVPEPAEPAIAPTANIGDAIAGLKSKDVAERRQAALVLHGAGADAKEAIPVLKDALKDSDQEVQMWAALALVNTQTYDKAVIPILIRGLKNENTVLRQVACLSLGLIPYEGGDKDTVIPALTEAATKDTDQDVRQAAKSALNIVNPENLESASSVK